MKRWGRISVAAVIALTVVGYLAFRRRPARVETCLRTKLADASGTVDDTLLRAALRLATRERGDFTIDSQNSTQPEAKALSEPKTWNAIAGCRARFVPAAAALRPPRHAVRARVSDRRGKQWVPLPGAQVYANPAGPYCVADEAGECTLTFFESAPQDRIELYATSSSGREGPVLAGTLGQLAKRGAALQTTRSYPTLNVSITDCKTH